MKYKESCYLSHGGLCSVFVSITLPQSFASKFFRSLYRVSYLSESIHILNIGALEDLLWFQLNWFLHIVFYMYFEDCLINLHHLWDVGSMWHKLFISVIAVIQWITSCHKNGHMTTRVITLWRIYVMSFWQRPCQQWVFFLKYSSAQELKPNLKGHMINRILHS